MQDDCRILWFQAIERIFVACCSHDIEHSGRWVAADEATEARTQPFQRTEAAAVS